MEAHGVKVTQLSPAEHDAFRKATAKVYEVEETGRGRPGDQNGSGHRQALSLARRGMTTGGADAPPVFLSAISGVIQIHPISRA